MPRFSPSEEASILQSIRTAELRTSGEIRVHLDKKCASDKGYETALHWFGKLGMHKTDSRNGILFYLALESHVFAVVGDEGIHQCVGPEFWTHLTETAVAEFKEGRLADGLCHAILACGEKLQHHFPYQSKSDSNELSNEISRMQ